MNCLKHFLKTCEEAFSNLSIVVVLLTKVVLLFM